MIVLNGTRNFELLTNYVKLILQTHLSLPFGYYLYQEHYPTMDQSNLPALNILLKSVNEIRRDSNTTVNECVVTIIGYAKCDDMGNDNSLHSKTELLKMLGQVNNIFSKRSSYDIVPNHMIQNIQLQDMVFSTPADFNSSQIILGQQELKVILTETNDNAFQEFLDTSFSEINNNIQIVFE